MENYFNCIYCYTNKINGKKYVGQTINFNTRHQQHCYNSFYENSIDYNLPFHRAIRKYGIENFEINILKENLTSQCLLNFWESYYIDKFDSLAKNQKGYNLASGGSNGNPLAGKTDEELAEISRKISEAHKGEKHPMYGKKLSEETRAKQSEAHKGEKHPMYGKNHSEETRAKMSEAKKGLLAGEKNPMYGRTGEKHPMYGRTGKEHPMYGKKLSEETRAKQSEAKKGENNPRSRKIILIDALTRLPVFTWQYQKQATDFYGISGATLNYYLKGKAKSGHEYNGFLWYYFDEWQQLTK